MSFYQSDEADRQAKEDDDDIIIAACLGMSLEEYRSERNGGFR